MRRLFVWGIGIALMVGCATQRPVPPAPPPPPIDQSLLIWHDEFDGNALDMSKWGYRALGPRKKGVIAKDAISLDGKGHLVITMSKVGNTYQSGMISTQGKFEHKFGYWECRMKFQDQPGTHSAFWLTSSKLGKYIGDTHRSGTEIDIIEYLIKYPNKAFHRLHWDGYGEHHQQVGTNEVVAGLADGFHVIGLDWRQDEYIFYVDGIERWRTKEAISHVDQFIILSMELSDWGGDASKAKLPDRLYFDYVRVYSRKPDSTPTQGSSGK